ncbi:uncharacterized protein TNCV_4509011 [Trichonephila clavipes]|nr:uncharacterized protein TNCV_4509011 [Trichonephila clavipes]
MLTLSEYSSIPEEALMDSPSAHKKCEVTDQKGSKVCCCYLCHLKTVTSDQGSRNSSWRKARFLRLSLALALSTMQVTVPQALFYPNFEGEHSGDGQGPPTSLSLPPTSREDLRFDGFTKNSCLLQDSNPGPTALHAASVTTILDEWLQWLATLTAVPLGLGSNPGEDMDVCKCIVASRHGCTLNSRRAASPLVRLVEGKERWEASDHPRGFSLNIEVKPS